MLSRVLKKIIYLFKYFPHIILWRIKNKHNLTHAINVLNSNTVIVGNHTYGPIEVLYDTGISKINIGNYCSIANKVKLFAGGEHDYRRISTYPFQTLVYKNTGRLDRYYNLDINIEDDVWIGYDCIVLPGTTIGRGSVIGARSVVKGYIPPYSIYVGNKVIKSRFSQEVIDKLKNIDFTSIEHCYGDSYQDYCTSVVSDKNLSDVLDAFIN